MQIVVTNPEALAVARLGVDAELDAVEAAASRFRADSEITLLATSEGRPTEVSELLADLLDAALTAARQTGGDVDPTVGAAMVALGADGDTADLRVEPRAASIRMIADWSMVTLKGRVVTVPKGIQLDLGATAKAVTADHCARIAHDATGSGVLVNLGGDIATAGPAPESGWQVLVRDADGDPEDVVALAGGGAMATSSTLRRRWRRGPDEWHHILDPHTGHSADPVWRTVSVAAATCYAANTVSTAAIVRGWSALHWIRSLGLAARLVDRDRVVHEVCGWPRKHHEVQP
jgi:FAD:protein FMN transferase